MLQESHNQYDTITDFSHSDLNETSDFNHIPLILSKLFDFKRHPYFEWLKIAKKEDFLKSQIPFLKAVEGFSCSLAACLARIDLLENRKDLAENVAEEHGMTAKGISHKETFKEYLRALGANETQIYSTQTVNVLAFNESTKNFCLTHPHYTSAAMLGIIEYLYIDISAQIAKHISENSWVLPGGQRHYETHEVLDVVHARDLLKISAPYWEVEQLRPEIAKGFFLGCHYFWQLYLGMLPKFL